MKRQAAAILLALAALGALPAAKPAPPADPRETARFLAREAWRGQAVSMCVARLREIRNFSPDDLEIICGCTFDTYLQGHGTEPLPGLGAERIPVAVQSQLVSCTARMRPDQLNAVRELGHRAPATLPPGALTGADAPKPAGDAALGPPAESDRGNDGGGFRDWVRSITLPDWLTGAGVLWWIAIGIFVFGLLILKVRRSDPRNDLMGPPSSMRRGTPAQPPRRPDLPR